jgi:hypothetical protein
MFYSSIATLIREKIELKGEGRKKSLQKCTDFQIKFNQPAAADKSKQMIGHRT